MKREHLRADDCIEIDGGAKYHVVTSCGKFRCLRNVHGDRELGADEPFKVISKVCVENFPAKGLYMLRRGDRIEVVFPDGVKEGVFGSKLNLPYGVFDGVERSFSGECWKCLQRVDDMGPLRINIATGTVGIGTPSAPTTPPPPKPKKPEPVHVEPIIWCGPPKLNRYEPASHCASALFFEQARQEAIERGQLAIRRKLREWPTDKTLSIHVEGAANVDMPASVEFWFR